MPALSSWPSIPALLLLCGAVSSVEARPMTEAELAEYQARTVLAESGKLLHHDVPSVEIFERAKTLGVRSDGLYWQTEVNSIDREEIVRFGKRRNFYTQYFRFCEDGSVIGVSTSGLPHQIRSWFTCQPVNPRFPHGVIRIEGEVIRMSMHSTTGVVDYWGVVDADRGAGPKDLILSVRTNIPAAENYGKTLQETYRFLPD